MTILDTLNTVLAKVQQNRANVATQIVASTKAMGDPAADVQAAIDLLIKTYGTNVQTIGQTIGAQLQIEQLNTALVEIDAMIAGLQVLLSDDAAIEATGTLVAQGVADGPLSLAAGNSQPSAANDAAPAQAASAPAEAVDAGTASPPSPPSDGASA
jgi:hypothetical protein